MYAFPRKIDAWLEDVDVTSDRPQVSFSRYECASDDADPTV